MDKDKQIERLSAELAASQQNTMKAAEAGKMLLEENQELNNRMEELRRATDKRLELSEQERHCLQVRLEQKVGQEDWYSEELAHLKQQLTDSQTSVRETLEAEKAQELAKLSRRIDELRTDLDVASSTEQQLREKTAELEELLAERLSQTVASQSRSFNGTEELATLEDEVNNLQCEVGTLKSQLIEKRAELQTRELEVETLRSKLIGRDEELEELKCHVTSLSNTIEEVRMEKMDLQCQLDALRMETSGHRKKGNSIFSELDDRRLEAEKQLISLQVMNDSLKEKFLVEKQTNQKCKRQISQLLLQLSSGRVDSDYVANLESKLVMFTRQISQLLLQLSSGRVDSDYVANLESKLVQAREEVRTLIEEKTNLQDKQQREVKVMTSLDGHKTGGGDGDYTQYLVTLIDGKEQELQKVQQELSHKTIQLLDEKSRTSGQECRIKQLEADKDRIRSSSMKLKLRLDELQLKYEPDAIKKSGALVVKRTERIPLDEPEEVKITETSRIHDNSTISQPKYTNLHEHRPTSKPLVEKLENSTKDCTIDTGIKPISKCIKTKSVSISDDVEEHEIEPVEADMENKSLAGQDRRKSKKITAVKHVTSKPTKDVNECKSQ